MNKINKIFTLLVLGFAVVGCKDVLDLEPIDKITAEDLFADPAGTALYMADLYDRLPIEDFTYFPRNGFNYNNGNPNNGGFSNVMLTKWAHHSEGNRFINGDYLNWWDDAYTLIRNTNLFIETIPSLTVNDDQKAIYLGEASFIRAFAYFGLVKRYGGVPIITDAQIYDSSNPDALLVPRSTEKETWDFILAECDIAASNLGHDSNERRASKWAALALKARAALHAASIAKYGGNVDLFGQAVDEKLVGIDAASANDFYAVAIAAADSIMEYGPYGLYMATPANPQEAAENYRIMFENPNLAIGSEAMLIKGRVIPGNDYGNNYNIWYNPAQLTNGWPHPGRMNPTLDLVDLFENYSTPGQSAPVVTTVDGDTENYLGFDPNRTYIKHASPTDAFADKDARLHASIVVPSSMWKDTEIILQAGYIDPSGTPVTLTKASIDVDGQKYHTYGGANATVDYSGFDPTGGNHSRTGFSFKKFLWSDPVVPAWNQGTNDFMEFRYAEVLLTYAEAVVESGLGDPAKAETAMNATRKRAGHTVDIPLTIDNVKRERTVELCFENKGIWDLMRRREYHIEFNASQKHALQLVQDLRTAPYEYIYLRTGVLNNTPQTFDMEDYYRRVPGLGINKLVQNPGY